MPTINAQCAGTNSYILADVPSASRVIGRSAVRMKVIMAPIEMIAWFDIPGTPRPIRFRHDGNVVKVELIKRISEEKIAGNRMKVYECQSEVHGLMKHFQLKYEVNTCKWFLYKI
ncbi:hypothetical protein [Desulfosporosinus sp. FKA]|uniref:hypothetical protein n=1 Tax=Desulfosporosinus sp. FKA TaxID=1969834 RepID=UPI0032B7B58B